MVEPDQGETVDKDFFKQLKEVSQILSDSHGGLQLCQCLLRGQCDGTQAIQIFGVHGRQFSDASAEQAN